MIPYYPYVQTKQLKGIDGGRPVEQVRLNTPHSTPYQECTQGGGEGEGGRPNRLAPERERQLDYR